MTLPELGFSENSLTLYEKMLKCHTE